MLSGEKVRVLTLVLNGKRYFNRTFIVLMSIPFKTEIAAIKLNDHTCPHYSIKDGT